MTYEQAKELKVGDLVTYPEDRGEKGGTGRVSHISTTPQVNIDGVQYIWVRVTANGKSCGVWPSNRLTRK